ncbi:MAG: macro domain-containing protein [bacterium]|nr:macro domain-containing protein [bacterium]
MSHGLGKAHLSGPRSEERRLREEEGRTTWLWFGATSRSHVSTVIVNAANEDPQQGRGLAAALARAGGEEFVKDSQRWVSENVPLPTGRMAVTVGGRLRAEWVVHVAGPRYRAGQNIWRFSGGRCLQPWALR